jgi:hypothetical protein
LNANDRSASARGTPSWPLSRILCSRLLGPRFRELDYAAGVELHRASGMFLFRLITNA